MTPKIYRYIFCLSFTVIACREGTKEAITIGTIEKIHSTVLNETRELWISLPQNYDEKDTTALYPVLYLLDGDDHFHAVTGLVHQLSENAIVPEMIVVAVLNTDRSRDMTPTRSLKLPDGSEQNWLSSTGGAENFAKFIRDELVPFVEDKYPAAPHRILAGHSFGGLFTIHTLVNHPDLFNSYLAVDPSLWWDEGKLLDQYETALSEKSFAKENVFLSVANTMQVGMDTLMVESDTSSVTIHIRSIIRFAKTASASAENNGMNFAWRYYHEDDHGSVPLISTYDGLRFLFSYFKLPVFDNDITADVVSLHFQNVSDLIGYKVLPPEETMNSAGYHFLRTKQFEQAFGFFELNIRNYPQSQNVHDSMGDYYVEVGEKKKAIECYRKALAIGESETTRQKLDDLEETDD